MGRKSKVSVETKLKAVERYLQDGISTTNIATELQVPQGTIKGWIRKHQIFGAQGLYPSSRNAGYTAEFKLQVVKEFLVGGISQADLAAKYKIPSDSQIVQWIKLYNNHKEFKTSNTGGQTIMIKGRNTTLAERIEIVTYCIEHQNDYNKTAEKFDVSYQQVYTWVKKYTSNGVDGLQDRRGRRKPTEDMTELELLQAEHRLLQAQYKRQEMELNFLKKLEEIERRRR